MNELKFLKGQYANYTGLTSKDASAFYVTTEVVNEKNVLALWLGADLIASGNTAAELQAEISRAQLVENNLQIAINGEASERATQDENLQKAIDKAISDFKAAMEEMGDEWNEALSAETEARIADVNAEEARAISTETALAEALAAEVSARTDADQALSDRIDAITMSPLTEEEMTLLGANVKEAFKLVVDGKQKGSTIKIYKDSALKEVKLSGQTLMFTYILNDGSEDTVGVDVSKFLAETEFKDGLDVIDGQVWVNVANAASAKTTPDVIVDKNFLQLEADGDGNKALAVRSIDTDCTVIQKPISVAGISGQFGSGIYKNGDTIPAGTDVYTILRNILSQELYPKAADVKCTSGKVSASLAALTLTLDKSSVQEVGTKVTLTEGKTNGSSSAKTASTVVGMSYGWSAADDDSRDSQWDLAANTGVTSVTVNPTSSIKDDKYTVSATINSGFGADTTTFVKTTPTTVTGEGSAALAQTVLGCLEEGDNKITINATGASYNYSIEKIDGMYYCSNLGNTDASAYTTGVSAVSSSTSKPTNTANKTVTAQYKYFLGYSSNTKFSEFNSASVRALTTKSSWITKDGTTTIVGTAATTSNGSSIVVACPAKYKLATITNGVGADILANFVSFGNVDVKCGEITVPYKVYVYPITNGATVEFKNVTLTKA